MNSVLKPGHLLGKFNRYSLIVLYRNSNLRTIKYLNMEGKIAASCKLGNFFQFLDADSIKTAIETAVAETVWD